MAGKKRLYQGEGWSFEPADAKPRTDVASLPPEKQRPRISLEKRKAGRVVTMLAGFALSAEDMKGLARELKTACGTGGTVRGDSIELQGDQRETARAWLAGKGYSI